MEVWWFQTARWQTPCLWSWTGWSQCCKYSHPGCKDNLKKEAREKELQISHIQRMHFKNKNTPSTLPGLNTLWEWNVVRAEWVNKWPLSRSLIRDFEMVHKPNCSDAVWHIFEWKMFMFLSYCCGFSSETQIWLWLLFYNDIKSTSFASYQIDLLSLLLKILDH